MYLDCEKHNPNKTHCEMSRLLQAGDYALIDHQRYLIREIQPGVIYIASDIFTPDRSALVWVDDQWTVYQDNRPHQITFKRALNERVLTGLPEVDLQILAEVPLNVLENICQTSSLAREYCQDPYLWQMRLEQDYPDLQKPSDLSEREWYYRLSRMNASEAAQKGYLKVLKERLQQGSTIGMRDLYRAAYQGHLPVVQFLLEKYPQANVRLIYLASAYGNQVDIVTWLEQQGYHYSVYPNILAYLNNLDMLKYSGMVPDNYIASYAYAGNAVDVLEWAAQQQVFPDFDFIDQDSLHWEDDIIDNFITAGLPEEWLNREYIQDVDGIPTVLPTPEVKAWAERWNIHLD